MNEWQKYMTSERAIYCGTNEYIWHIIAVHNVLLNAKCDSEISNKTDKNTPIEQFYCHTYNIVSYKVNMPETTYVIANVFQPNIYITCSMVIFQIFYCVCINDIIHYYLLAGHYL